MTELTAVMLRKTRHCQFYASGRCERGDACGYAHGAGELAMAPDFSFTRICESWKRTGTCARGGRCKFAHGKVQLLPWKRDAVAAAGSVRTAALTQEGVGQVQSKPLLSTAARHRRQQRRAGNRGSEEAERHVQPPTLEERGASSKRRGRGGHQLQEHTSTVKAAVRNESSEHDLGRHCEYGVSKDCRVVIKNTFIHVCSQEQSEDQRRVRSEPPAQQQARGNSSSVVRTKYGGARRTGNEVEEEKASMATSNERAVDECSSWYEEQTQKAESVFGGNCAVAQAGAQQSPM